MKSIGTPVGFIAFFASSKHSRNYACLGEGAALFRTAASDEERSQDGESDERGRSSKIHTM